MKGSTLIGWLVLASPGLACRCTTSSPTDSTRPPSAVAESALPSKTRAEPAPAIAPETSAPNLRLVRDQGSAVYFESQTHPSLSTVLAEFSSSEALDKIGRGRLLTSLDPSVGPMTELPVYVQICPTMAEDDPQRARDALGLLGLDPAQLSGNIARGRVTLKRLPQLADSSCVERIELPAKVYLREPQAPSPPMETTTGGSPAVVTGP